MKTFVMKKKLAKIVPLDNQNDLIHENIGKIVGLVQEENDALKLKLKEYEEEKNKMYNILQKSTVLMETCIGKYKSILHEKDETLLRQANTIESQEELLKQQSIRINDAETEIQRSERELQDTWRTIQDYDEEIFHLNNTLSRFNNNKNVRKRYR